MRIQAGADLVDKILEQDRVSYGVTTGYGDSCDADIVVCRQPVMGWEHRNRPRCSVID